MPGSCRPGAFSLPLGRPFHRVEVGLCRWSESDDSNIRWHFECFFTVFVFQNKRLTVVTGDFRRNRGIRHRTVGHEIPRPMALTSSAHCLGKYMDFDSLRAEACGRSRHRGLYLMRERRDHAPRGERHRECGGCQREIDLRLARVLHTGPLSRFIAIPSTLKRARHGPYDFFESLSDQCTNGLSFPAA